MFTGVLENELLLRFAWPLSVGRNWYIILSVFPLWNSIGLFIDLFSWSHLGHVIGGISMSVGVTANSFLWDFTGTPVSM